MKKVTTFQHCWIKLSTLCLFVLLSPLAINAQTNYRLDLQKKPLVEVAGTSNVHDWTMKANAVESQGTFKLNGKELVGVSSLSFSVQAKSLKSGKASMDTRTYKSIRADEFPKISYQLKSATVTPLQAHKYQLQTTGNLTIASATQLISLTVMATVNADGSIVCTASTPLKLTDYKIEPPSFMLGAMKVGNGLQIKFELTYTD